MINWNDIKIFRAVSRFGGLAGAEAETGLSAPTLGRRISALERSLGSQLFRRHRLGYDLTAAGQEFLERTQSFEHGAVAVERWQAARVPEPLVRVAAGAWTSTFLAQNLEAILGADTNTRLEILTGVGFIDLSRREANLGIRNRRPHQIGLAGRKIGEVNFAIYGAPSYLKAAPGAETAARYEQCQWVTLSARGGAIPSLTWLEQLMSRPAQVVCSSPNTVFDAVINGAGLCVLPCFIAESEPRLRRVSDTITDLKSTRWLVSHDDDRHEKPIRQIAKRLAELFLSAG